MDTDEHVAVELVCTIAQLDETVRLAGEVNFQPCVGEVHAGPFGDVQHYALLLNTMATAGAAIEPAVAGIEDHHVVTAERQVT